MTPLEIKNELIALRSEVGSKAYISVDISPHNAEAVSGCIYPTGIGTNGARLSVRGHDWREIIDQMRAAWVAHRDQHTAQMIKDMALEIIRITAEHDECTDAALRAGKFSDADVTRLGDQACAYATEIAANGPFTIVAMRGANAA